ncbi:MAG: S24/S26 family peptidase [Candidatus Binatia bacterium]
MPQQPQDLVTESAAGAQRLALVERVGRELIATALRAGRRVRFVAAGASMVPAVWPGDVLQAQPVSAQDIAEGQLLVFNRDGRLFVHRVVARSGQGDCPRLLTQGDAHEQCDPPVCPTQVLGVVTAILRDGRRVCTDPRRPSLALRLVSHGVRRSQLFRRALLRAHALRRRSWHSGGARLSTV